MIVDTLANLDRYRGLDPRLDRGLAALKELDVERTAGSALREGRNELAGADLYAGLSSYRTQAPEAKAFEAHRRYLDIQVVLQGRETMSWAPLERLTLTVPYSAAEDIAYYRLAEGPGGLGMGVPLEPGLFAVLFPQDGHRPGCHPAAGEAVAVRKLVLKVRCDAT
jgi:biofilm protein TabA